MDTSTTEMTKTPTKNADTVDLVRRLKIAVCDMDALAHIGFSEISAIARLTLLAMETPSGCSNLENIAQALKAIQGKADDIENCINSEAEGVGSNYRDPGTERRYAAYRSARAQGAFN